MAFKHKDFEIGSIIKVEFKDKKREAIEGRVVDLYLANEVEFALIVKPGSFFHHPVKLDDVKKVTVLK